jgi:hypothetical protein
MFQAWVCEPAQTLSTKKIENESFTGNKYLCPDD